MVLLPIDDGAAIDMVLRYGREVTVLGDVLVEGIDPTTAVALSPGRFPKRTRTIDDNEDAVLAARQGHRVLLAVADGHHGATAPEAAIAAVSRIAARILTVPEPALEQVFADLVASVGSAVAQAVRTAEPPRERSGTALSVAVISGRRLLAFTMGDTAVIRVSRQGRVRRIGSPTAFLGATVPQVTVRVTKLRRGDRVVCATDGLLDFIGGPWEARLADAGALESAPRDAVEALVRSAFATGAADHIAVALWADDAPPG